MINLQPSTFNLQPSTEFMEELKKQALIDHLRELRECLIKSVIAVALGFSVTYTFSRELGDIVFLPLFQVMPADTSLIFSAYQEGFFFI